MEEKFYMKKILAALITLFIVMPVFITGAAYAKTKKQPEKIDKTEYLNLSWWEKYNDPILTGYIQELYEKNHDLKIAALKVKEGEKLVRISFANELPQISFDGSFGRVMPSSNQQLGKLIVPSFSQYQFQMPLTASYEIDIWGENRLRTKSIAQQLEIIKQEERASYIALTSAFASVYFNLIKTDKLLDIQKDIVASQEEITKKTQKKFENGLCSVNEVINEEKFLTSQKEALNNLEHTKTVLENQLRVYLSDNNKELSRTDAEDIFVLKELPVRIDSSVVEMRPDYAESEANIKRIGYDVRVSRKEFLPKFIIYGQIVFNAYQWSKMFNSYSQLANAGIMPSFDLFSGGRKIAVLKLKKYQYEEAMHDYQKTILSGIQEVNDSCAQVKTDLKNYEQSVNRLSLENRKYLLMQHKNKIGAASDLDVLYNKEQALMTKREEVSNKINYLIATIGLYKAVGGQDLYKLEPAQKEVKSEDI